MAVKVVLGMSGGVDSAVSAWLLKEQGYDVTGVFMKNWEDDDDSEYCSSRQDFLDAASAAEKIGIDLEAVNFAKEYKERVFSEFLREYQSGRTPNPDVLCNSEIKFNAFLDYAMELGAEKIATGHYARVRQTDNGVELLRGLDGSKDQSYFLHRLNQKQLEKAIFPVGELPKTKVREIARMLDLSVAGKKDSTGICFIGERNFKRFLMEFLPAQPGDMVDLTGRVVGRHDGLMYYTLGQRRGLGIGGMAAGTGESWFVIGKDMARNLLIVQQGEREELFSTGLYANKVQFIAGTPPGGRFACTAKFRYRQSDQPVRVQMEGDGCWVDFEQPQRAVTPGQWVVFYDGEVCLGGGPIDETRPLKPIRLGGEG